MDHSIMIIDVQLRDQLGTVGKNMVGQCHEDDV